MKSECNIEDYKSPLLCLPFISDYLFHFLSYFSLPYSSIAYALSYSSVFDCMVFLPYSSPPPLLLPSSTYLSCSTYCPHLSLNIVFQISYSSFTSFCHCPSFYFLSLFLSLGLSLARSLYLSRVLLCIYVVCHHVPSLTILYLSLPHCPL